MGYRVLRRIAQGGFSEVFEVEDPDSALPESLILKRLNEEMSARPEVRAAFSDEAKMLRDLRHPNVVTFRRCYFDEQQRVCLVMEKVAGEPLDRWAARHAAQPERVFDVFDRVLQAVDYLHHRPVPFLHLDLKPDNILISPTPEGPQPVLIDFGIARRSGGTGLRAYTPPYGAPEQQSGGRLDGSTDVYALGQILRELLQVSAAALQPARLEALAAVADKAAQPSRRDRFADAGELRTALRRARAGQAPVHRSLLPHKLSLPRPPVLGAAAAFLILAAVTLAWLFSSPGSPPKASPESAANGSQPSDDQLRRQFSEVQYAFEDALIQGKQDASDHYLQARDLSDTVPEGSETWRWMKRELDTMSAHLNTSRYGGPAGEQVRVLLRQKHLTNPRPWSGEATP